MMLRMFLLIALVTSATSAYAQNQITVVGAGFIVWNQVAPTLTDAQTYDYRLYIPSDSNVPVLVPAVCKVIDGQSSTFICSTQLTNLPLTSQFQRIGLTSGVTAVDGTIESTRTLSDCVNRRIGPPPAPTFPVTPIVKTP